MRKILVLSAPIKIRFFRMFAQVVEAALAEAGAKKQFRAIL